MKKKKELVVPKDYVITPTGSKLLIINVTEDYYICECGPRYISRNDILSGRYQIITENHPIFNN
jgi:hypothetical protein